MSERQVRHSTSFSGTGSGGLGDLKMEPKMLVGGFCVLRIEGALLGFSRGGSGAAVCETGRVLWVEVLLRCKGGAGSFSRKDVLRVMGALSFGRSPDFRRSCV